MGRFDVARIIQRFGGRMALHKQLLARGHTVSIKMVEKWRERERIPDVWLAELLAISAEQKKPMNLSDYVKKKPAAQTIPPHKLKQQQAAEDIDVLA